jgi:lipopolysaccharide transport system permease protein
MIQRLRELYAYRELIYNLVVRNLKVRYRNSLLGFVWAWGNPLLMTLVFTTVFKVLLQSQIHKFPLFILTAYLVWSFATSAITDGVGSVVQNSSLVKKIYFPREILPMSVVLSGAANFLLALPLVFILMLIYQVPLLPGLLVYVPVVFVSQIALLLGIVLVLSALNVFFRDTQVISNVLLTAWFFLTPVFYPTTALPANWNGIDLHRWMYILNPLASIIESYRNVLYGSVDGGPPGPPDIAFLARTLATSLLVMVVGYVIFARYSRQFAEEL